MKINFLYLIFALLLSLGTFGILRSLPPSTWERWKPATCLSSGCFCEAVSYANPVRQPANTWSSLAFVFAGSLVLGIHKSNRKSPGAEIASPYALMFAASAIVIGLGSAFFHASLTLLGQFFDVFGMYLLASFMLAYALKRLLKWTDSRTLVFFVTLNLLLSLALIQVPDTRRYAFALVLLVAIAIETLFRRLRKPRVAVRWWNIGFAVFAVGYAIWLLDNMGMVCSPFSALQGHAIWHIMGAIAVVCLYRYYRSEVSEAFNET